MNSQRIENGGIANQIRDAAVRFVQQITASYKRRSFS